MVASLARATGKLLVSEIRQGGEGEGEILWLLPPPALLSPTSASHWANISGSPLTGAWETAHRCQPPLHMETHRTEQEVGEEGI